MNSCVKNTEAIKVAIIKNIVDKKRENIVEYKKSDGRMLRHKDVLMLTVHRHITGNASGKIETSFARAVVR
uniref:Uncharacterized protein n=1 Tax=Heterorhabditis bacteriophora TaxID=37862 RepID=A0A1I7X8N3_HETBA